MIKKKNTILRLKFCLSGHKTTCISEVVGTVYGASYEIDLLRTLLSSEGSSKSAQLGRLARAFVARIHKDFGLYCFAEQQKLWQACIKHRLIRTFAACIHKE